MPVAEPTSTRSGSSRSPASHDQSDIKGTLRDPAHRSWPHRNAQAGPGSDLRHFYASPLIAANLNPKIIQARLGHATLAETMDTYGHLFADTEDLGRTAVDQVLRPLLTEPERNWSVHDYKPAGQSEGGGRAGL